MITPPAEPVLHDHGVFLGPCAKNAPYEAGGCVSLSEMRGSRGDSGWRLHVTPGCLAECVGHTLVWRRPLMLAGPGPSGPIPQRRSPPGACVARIRAFWEKTTPVAVKIKLKRMGKIHAPYYRIIVADARTKRDGRAIEEIGKYHPKSEPSFIAVDSDRAQHWLSVGAQPTDPVGKILEITGDWQKLKK